MLNKRRRGGASFFAGLSGLSTSRESSSEWTPTLIDTEYDLEVLSDFEELSRLSPIDSDASQNYEEIIKVSLRFPEDLDRV
jgi:hypothetical protein